MGGAWLEGAGLPTEGRDLVHREGGTFLTRGPACFPVGAGHVPPGAGHPSPGVGPGSPPLALPSPSLQTGRPSLRKPVAV